MTFRDLTPAQVEAIRQQFVTSGKPAKIGEPFGLSGKQVSDYACKHDWKIEKAKISEVLAEKSPEAIAARLVVTAADYVTQHTDDWQALRAHVFALLDAKWADLTEEAFDEMKAKAGLAIGAGQFFEKMQKGQRLSLGLDKAAPATDTQTEGAGLVIVPKKDIPSVSHRMATEPRPTD